MIPMKLGYKSIDDDFEVTKPMTRKRVMSRLRSMKLFGKRDDRDQDPNKVNMKVLFVSMTS